MTRKELYEKFLKLSAKYENLFNNSDLDITQEEFDGTSNWIKNIAYVLGFEPVNFTEKNLKTFENTYNEAEKIVYSRYLK